MNLRWLWLDHIPAGMTLTREERVTVRQLARKRRRQSRLPGQSRGGTVWLCVAALVTVFFLFLIWLASLPRMGFGTTGLTISNGGSILIFNLLLWWCIAWLINRTNAPYVWWALCEIGKPVCIRCGYILIDASNAGRPCPECGENPEPKPRDIKP